MYNTAYPSIRIIRPMNRMYIGIDVHKEPKIRENSRINYEFLDVRDRKAVDNIIRNKNIDEVYHLASILSATGEKDPYLFYVSCNTGIQYIYCTC